MARSFREAKSRETFLSYFGPLSLLILFARLGGGSSFVGFALLYYSAATAGLDSSHV